MGAWLERRAGSAYLAAGLMLAAFVVILVVAGGQTRTILSTVGASVGPPTGAMAQTQTGPEDEQPARTDRATPGPQVATTDAALAPAPGLLIVHTGTVKVRVEAIGPAIDRMTSIVTGAGGFVATSATSGSGASAHATLDLRIPAAAWDRALTDVRTVGTVLDQEIGSEEVTGQVIDLDARVANLRATEAALQAIMAKATRIQDILDVQEQLTTTRGQIEELTAKAAGLRDRAAFGSLSVQLSVPAPVVTPAPTPVKPALWDPGRDVELATGKLVRLGQVAMTDAIWLAIVGVPILLALLIGLGILRLAWLGARRAGLVGGREPG